MVRSAWEVVSGGGNAHRSAREDQRIISHNASHREEEGIEVEEQQLTRAPASFADPESNSFEHACAVQCY